MAYLVIKTIKVVPLKLTMRDFEFENAFHDYFQSEEPQLRETTRYTDNTISADYPSKENSLKEKNIGNETPDNTLGVTGEKLPKEDFSELKENSEFSELKESNESSFNLPINILTDTDGDYIKRLPAFSVSLIMSLLIMVMAVMWSVAMVLGTKSLIGRNADTFKKNNFDNSDISDYKDSTVSEEKTDALTDLPEAMIKEQISEKEDEPYNNLKNDIPNLSEYSGRRDIPKISIERQNNKVEVSSSAFSPPEKTSGETGYALTDFLLLCGFDIKEIENDFFSISGDGFTANIEFFSNPYKWEEKKISFFADKNWVNKGTYYEKSSENMFYFSEENIKKIASDIEDIPHEIFEVAQTDGKGTREELTDKNQNKILKWKTEADNGTSGYTNTVFERVFLLNGVFIYAEGTKYTENDAIMSIREKNALNLARDCFGSSFAMRKIAVLYMEKEVSSDKRSFSYFVSCLP